MLDTQGRDTRLLTVLSAVLAIGLGLAGALPRWWWSAAGDDPVLGRVEMKLGLRGVQTCAHHPRAPAPICDDHAYADTRPTITGETGAVFEWEARVAWWCTLAMAVACLIRGAQSIARAGSRLVELLMTLLALAVVLTSAHLLKEGPGVASAELGPGGPLTIAGGVLAIACARVASRDVMR